MLAVVFATFAAFLGEPFIPFAAASLAGLWLCEREKPGIFSVLVPCAVLLVNFLIGGLISVIGIEILIVALILVLALKKRAKKSETAFILTAVIFVITLLSLACAAINVTGEFTLDAIKVFYSDLLENLRDAFIKMAESYVAALQTSSSAAIEIPVDDINLVFDAMVGGLIGMLVSLCFVMAGITLKLFVAVARRLMPNDAFLAAWHFTTPSLYAYAFMALYILSIFVGGTDAFSLTVTNLTTVFTTVYAYVGASVVYSMLSGRLGRWKSLLIIGAVALMFSGIAFRLLAFFGAYATVAANKFNELKGDPDNR